MEAPILNAHNKEEYPPMHTAEHILNGTMVRLFGCPRSRNAHIERKKSKCDYLLDACPTEAEVARIEAAVNEVIGRNLDVTIEYMPRSEAAALVDLSKLPEDASETLRIVGGLRRLRLHRRAREEHGGNRDLQDPQPRLCGRPLAGPLERHRIKHLI